MTTSLQPEVAGLKAAVDAFVEADRRQPPEPGAVLFVGSSTFTRWTDLAAAFPFTRVTNRSFGGSRWDDVLRYFDLLVPPHRPRLIVTYEGDNDLGGGQAPESVLAHCREFVGRVRAQLPGTPVAVVSIKPSPSRAHLADAIATANALIRADCEAADDLRYIDVVPGMVDGDGQPRAELYVEDGLHLTPAGYRVWQAAIAPILR